MKKKIIATVVFLILMAMLPFVAVKFNDPQTTAHITTATKDTPSKPIDKKTKILCGLVAANIKDNYCSETLKAIAIIINTNYKISPDSFDLDDTSVCIYEENADSSVKEIYPQIKTSVNSCKELHLTLDKEKQYIPFSKTSSGCTIVDKNYDYLTSVASPWDCFQKNYDADIKCCGVSISGVDYLCRNGYSAEEALLWYLPGFEIAK